MESLVTGVEGLQTLIKTLERQGFTVIGPTVRGDAIVYAEIAGVQDLPGGYGDEQDGAHYRLRRRDDNSLFGFAAPAQSAKPVFFPAQALMRRVRRTSDGTCTEQPPETSPKSAAPYALFGIRSCDLHALAIHDHVLAERAWVDDDYVLRRQGTFVVAATCTEPSSSCFCTSTSTGPQPESHYDLRLTELIDGKRHRFLLESGTPRGTRALAEIPGEKPDEAVRAEVDELVRSARARMGRALPAADLRQALYSQTGSPVWESVASRCLSCGNCTLVCPTCFCTSLTDTGDLSEVVERQRTWASCFTTDFSYLHGAVVRRSAASRYRQWMTHKLAAWIDQFGESGCVGCGRCITWCPVAIDITTQAAALVAEMASPAPSPEESR